MENTLHPSRFRFGIDLFPDSDGERIVLPFRRSALAILIVAAMTIIMTVPAISVFKQAAADWGRLDDLFDLVGALFSTGWLMGWSVGLLVLYGLLAVLLAGRETLILKPGSVQLRLGVPFLFVGVALDPGKIRRLQYTTPKPKSGKAWRGPHLAFEYAGTPMEVGSGLNELDAMQLAGRISALPAAPVTAADIPDTPDTQSSTNQRDPDATRPGTGKQVDTAPRMTLPALALVGANLLPVLGVLLLGWDLGAIMVLFWAESGIIGCYHLIKLCITRRWLVLLLGPVFVGHFGAFMAVHFLFIYGFFIEGLSGNGPGDSLAEVGQVFVELWPALLALALSHGISFIIHLPRHRTGRHTAIGEEMSAPYRRIVIMHLTIIIGGGLSLVIGTPVFALILLILLKTFVDLHSHQQQHLLDRTG